jgi:hypothetical protein
MARDLVNIPTRTEEEDIFILLQYHSSSSDLIFFGF